MAWVNPNNESAFRNNRMFFTWYGDSAINNLFTFGTLNGNLQFDGFSNNLNTTASLPSQQWSHVAITHDGSTVRLFLNGVQVGEKSTTLNTSTNSNTDVVIAGRRDSASSNRFLGKMADFVMLDYAIDPNDLETFYSNRIDPNQSGLVMYYPLNQDESSATDLSTPSGTSIPLGSPAARNDKHFDSASPAILGSGPYTKFIATSTSNQTRSELVAVNLEDNIAPVIALTGNSTITLPLNATYNEEGGIATDNCSADSNGVVIDNSSIDTSVAGTYTVTYNVTDTSGNSAVQVTRTVIVDGTAASLLSNSIASNNANNTAFAKARDEIFLTFTTDEETLLPVVTIANRTARVEPTANLNEYVASIIVPSLNQVGILSLPDGRIPFSIALEDLFNNQSIITNTTDGSTMTIDRTLPSLVTRNATLTLNAGGTATINDPADLIDTATDVNGVTININRFNYDCEDVGFQPVLVDVSDAAGNIITDVALLEVIDNQAPVLTLNGASTITVSRGSTFNDPGVSISDNCSTGLTPVVGGDVVDTAVAGVYEVTYDVDDAGGNSAVQLVRTVMVQNPDFIYDNGAWTPRDPSDASNPSSFADNVIIRENVTVAGDFRANNLTVDTGVTLSLTSGVELSINNDFTGTIDAPQAAVVAYGQTTSNTWNSTSNTVIGRLHLSNANLVLTGTYRLVDRVSNDDTSSTSTLDVTAADFTFGSTANGTAVIDGANIDITGGVTVEQYYQNRRAFRFVSSSVNSSGSIFDNWQEEGSAPSDIGYEPGYGTHITGSSPASNGFDATATNNPSLFSWDNSSQTWNVVTNTNGTLNVGDYYRLMIRGDRSIDLGSNLSASSTTIRTRGTLLNGSYTLPSIAPNASEFMIIGNPYQRELPIGNLMNDLFNNSNTSINAILPNFYFIWDPMLNSRGGYRVYDRQTNAIVGPAPTTSNFEPGILKPGQSLFAVASGEAGGTFVLNKPDNSFTPPFFTPSMVSFTAQLELSLYETSQFQSGATALDATVIRFSNGNNNSVDQFDAFKFANLDETLGRTHSDGVELSIENRDLPVAGEVLNLSITNYRHTNYTFQVPAVQLVSQKAFLEDQFTGTLTELSNTATTNYSFTVDVNDSASSASDRFRIIFEDITLSAGDVAFEQAISLYPNPVDKGQFFINMAGIAGEKEVVMTNLLGQHIHEFTTQDTGIVEVQITDLAPAVYLVSVTSEGKTKTIKILVE